MQHTKTDVTMDNMKHDQEQLDRLKEYADFTGLLYPIHFQFIFHLWSRNESRKVLTNVARALNKL